MQSISLNTCRSFISSTDERWAIVSRWLAQDGRLADLATTAADGWASWYEAGRARDIMFQSALSDG